VGASRAPTTAAKKQGASLASAAILADRKARLSLRLGDDLHVARAMDEHMASEMPRSLCWCERTCWFAAL
jgi:hypothetical protein